MTRVLTIAALLVTFAVPAAAQTKGRVSVGGTVTYVKPTDGEVGPLVGFGGLVRLNPKKGWGFAGGSAGSAPTTVRHHRVRAATAFNRPSTCDSFTSPAAATRTEYRNQWKAESPFC